MYALHFYAPPCSQSIKFTPELPKFDNVRRLELNRVTFSWDVLLQRIPSVRELKLCNCGFTVRFCTSNHCTTVDYLEALPELEALQVLRLSTAIEYVGQQIDVSRLFSNLPQLPSLHTLSIELHLEGPAAAASGMPVVEGAAAMRAFLGRHQGGALRHLGLKIMDCHEDAAWLGLEWAQALHQQV
jgi:hypothetical protein